MILKNAKRASDASIFSSLSLLELTATSQSHLDLFQTLGRRRVVRRQHQALLVALDGFLELLLLLVRLSEIVPRRDVSRPQRDRLFVLNDRVVNLIGV